MDQAKTAILSALIYSDIFDYPLTKAELWRYLNTKKPISFKQFEKALLASEKVKIKDNFFHLSGRSFLISQRQKRQKISQRKMQKAKEAAKILSLIPTIELIGLSGSLALMNADKDADIDLFIIAKKQTLWITRLLIILLLQHKKLRRKRSAKKAPDSVCVNMLIDTEHLHFTKNRQDFYTAHELLQMKVLFARGFIYHELLRKNKWVETFLPNGFPKTILKEIPFQKETSLFIFRIIEPIAQLLQLWYMQGYITQETITKGFLAFHPYDYKKEIMHEWERRKKKYAV